MKELELQTNEPIQNYLLESSYIDYKHPSIANKIKELLAQVDQGLSVKAKELQFAEEMYTFVRDHIPHSYDIQGEKVTGKASEVLLHKQSICYGKSHLLAAFMRGVGIPAGICYQRLTLGESPGSGYAIHALNTIYLHSLQKWIRLDARGNKPGVNAQFSIENEKLAFPVRLEYDEQDYLINHSSPHPVIIETIEKHRHQSCMAMYLEHLPTHLE